MSAYLGFSRFIPNALVNSWLQEELGYRPTVTPDIVSREDTVLSIAYCDRRGSAAYLRQRGDPDYVARYVVQETALELELDPNSPEQAKHLTELLVRGWMRFGGDVDLKVADGRVAAIRGGVLSVRPEGTLEWPYDDPSNLEYLQRRWAEAKTSRGGEMR